MIDQLLNHKNERIPTYGILICLLGLMIFFLGDNFLIANILIIVGVELVLLELVRKYLMRKLSIKVLTNGILIFSILNFLRHSIFFIVLFNIRQSYENSAEFNWFLITESIWFIASVWILSRGLNLLFPKENINYQDYSSSKEFRFLILLILSLFALEIPVFGIHGDLGGYLHGHGFWDGWSHIH